MLNLFAIRCSLAFVPYLEENLRTFLCDQTGSSRVVKQGGLGLVMRYDDQISLRFQGRDSSLNTEDAAHYKATIEFRSEFFDITKLSDEVVLASIGRTLMLSHPQSEIWLESETVSHLVASASRSRVEYGTKAEWLPEWLDISSGDGRLLMSDQRSGRWVLLGEDHISDIERRISRLNDSAEYQRPKAPPTITIKGIQAHLQSVFRLADTLEEFASTGRFEPYDDIGPTFNLRVVKATEGIGMIDPDMRVGLNAREARKWAEILRAEIESLGATERVRGNIRTLFADTDQGLWILQSGDEVLITKDQCEKLRASYEFEHSDSIAVKRAGNLLLILTPANGNCVALDETEIEMLLREPAEA